MARIVGTSGNDVLRGTSHRDVIIGKGGNDKIIGRGGNDKLKGGKGNDTIKGNGGNDTLIGGKGKDKLTGGNGNDKLNGGAGNDKLDAGKGDDTLNGGSGNDLIDGGPGADDMTGGPGADIFKFDFGDGNFTDLGGGNVSIGDGIRDWENGVDLFDVPDPLLHFPDHVGAQPAFYTDAVYGQVGAVFYHGTGDSSSYFALADPTNLNKLDQTDFI